MKLKLSNDETELKLISNKDLDFEDIFKAYNLVMQRNDTLSVTDDDEPETDIKTSDESVSHSKLINEFDKANHAPVSGYVKVEVKCPKCGFTGIQTARMGFRFIKCNDCFTKLFLKPANGVWGVKDDKGMTYKAEDLYFDKSSNGNDEFAKESDEIVYSTKEEKIPDEYSSIPEIRAYLNKHHVENADIHLKPLLVDKLKDVKYSDK